MSFLKNYIEEWLQAYVCDYRDAQDALRSITEFKTFGNFKAIRCREPGSYAVFGPGIPLVLCSDSERLIFEEMIIERCHPAEYADEEEQRIFLITCDLAIYGPLFEPDDDDQTSFGERLVEETAETLKLAQEDARAAA